jgi:hypothetical protein
MPESPKADLHRYLQAARDALLWKLDGLAGTGVRGHGLAQIDARDVTARTDSCYEVGKVRPRTAANVEHVVAGPQPEAADHAREELARPSLCTQSAGGRPAAAPSALLPKGQPKFELDVVGSRSTTSVPIGDSAIGLNGVPFSARTSCHASRSSRDDTVNAMWSRPVRNSLSGLSLGILGSTITDAIVMALRHDCPRSG